MKLGVIVPTRGDREIFINHFKKQLSNQIFQPAEILFVDYKPKSDKVDITERYKYGYDYFRNKGFDLLAFMEDDDFYRSDYLIKMVSHWENNKRPDILGQDKTIYYNINLKKWLIMNHKTRSSAMNTFIKPDLNLTWCKDNEPYTDIWLWSLASINNNNSDKLLRGVIVNEQEIICMGIKHGIGKCGGFMHTNKLERYKNCDKDFKFLSQVTGEYFNFYSCVERPQPI